MEKGFINTLYNDFMCKQCSFNHHNGTLIDSLFDKEDIELMKSIKNNDGKLPCEFLKPLVIHKFFREIPLNVIKDVMEMYVTQINADFKSLQKYYKEKKMFLHTEFLRKLDFWQHEGISNTIIRAEVVYQWIEKARFSEFPRILKQLVLSDCSMIARMMVTIINDIPVGKQKVFLMLCFKCISYKDKKIGETYKYHSVLIRKPIAKYNVLLLEHAANAYMIYIQDIHTKYTITVENKHNTGKDFLNKTHVLDEWENWLIKHKNDTNLTQFVSHYELLRGKNNHKNIKVWKELIWQTFISRFINSNMHIDCYDAQNLKIKKIKK